MYKIVHSLGFWGVAAVCYAVAFSLVGLAVMSEVILTIAAFVIYGCILWFVLTRCL